MSGSSSTGGGAASGGSPSARGGESARGGAARPARRVVVSSVTGKPIDWEAQDASAPTPSRGGEPKVIPDRLAEDAPEPGADESNDARLSGDVPPHWGRGR
ncbi:hypothetical protein [Brachybacterium sp. sponge]|uniref:hypothetical protein n=1 Tax=Brachybacterium sp. sponge TaxID=1775432 RepID=UPI0007A5336F|nr:hypothetical protein [Brachybacterium sp. sponge]